MHFHRWRRPTPGTNLEWSNLNEWMDALVTLFRRSPSSKTYAQVKAHWEELSLDLAKKWINEADQPTARRFHSILQDRESHMGGHGLHSLKGSDKKWELFNMAVKNRQAALKGEKSPNRWKAIGKNSDGETLFEDKNGFRSYVKDGIRHMEQVVIRPTREGVQAVINRANRPEWRTAEELATEKPAKVEAPSTAGMSDVSTDALNKRRPDPFAIAQAQDQLHVTLKEPITEDDNTYGPVLEGEYLTQGGMHFVMLKGEGGIRSKVVGPIDTAKVVDIRVTKARDQIMNERFARSRGEPFDMELERTRDGYEKYLRALAHAIAKQADPRRRDQLEMQFDDVASEIELAKKKRRWLLAEAQYRNAGGAKDYPTRFDFTDSATDAVMKFQRPKPSDFEPNEKARRAREEADADRTSPRNLINDVRRQGFGARFSIDNPDGDPDHAIVLVIMPGGKEKGRFLLNGDRTDGTWAWTIDPYEPNESKAANARVRKAHASDDYKRLVELVANKAAEKPETASVETRVKALKDKMIVIASGMSRAKDMAAGSYTWGGRDDRGIGADVGELSTSAIDQLAKSVVDHKALLFVDSGAFSLFRRNLRDQEAADKEAMDLFGEEKPVRFRSMDFDKVLDRYDTVLDRIATHNEAEEDYPRPMLVMPDIVGDQAASLALLKKYAKDIKAHADFNVSRPVVPIPKGEISLANAYKLIVKYLGTDKFIVGIPSIEKVVSDSELRAFLEEARPNRVHFLGAVKKNIDQKLRILAEVGLDPEHLSADANILRSALYGRTGEGMTRAEGISKVLGEHGVNPTPIDPSNVPDHVNATRLDGVKPEETLVCMACGADKGTVRAPLFDLYRGPMWRTLNTHIGAIPRENVMVISGKLGFVPASTRAKPYEQQMTADKADTMIRDGIGVRQGQASPYEHTKDGGPYKGVIIAGAGEYRRVFNAYVMQMQELGVIAKDAQIVAVCGGIGQQRGRLGVFLRQVQGEGKASTSTATPGPPPVSSIATSISNLVTSVPDPGHGGSSGQRVREGWGLHDGLEPGEEFPAVRHGEYPMASAVQKVTLTSSQDIPFSKLILSKSNVRRSVAGVSIENLAEDIARRTLLQSLSVRPLLDAEGKETGTFEVQAGGRRYRALELLVKQKRMSKTQLVPCIVRTSGLAEEDSLAENVHRENLSALEQFLAFKTLREKGLGEEDIAARFFVSTTIVKQRLKLGAVSPKLLDIHAAGEMSLDQLMAFTVSDDHARQEEVWDQVSHTRGFSDEPYNIRRKLTEGAVRATDRRAVFIGVDAYEVAGGAVTRDLFEPDGGGWLQDPALLDRLVIEKLKAEAEKVQAEGWKWIAVATDFSYGHTQGLRSLHGRIVELTEQETAARQALEVELDGLQQQYAEADDVPEEADRRFEEIETELAAFNDRPVIYDPTEVALAGAFVSIDRDGTLRIDRGYVRPEDEPRTEPAETKGQEGAEAHRLPASASGGSQHGVITVGAAGASAAETEAEEDDGIRPLSDRLISELTAFRTLALRDAVANNPHVALTALLHKLCIDVFHQHAFENCIEATVREVSCPIQPADLDESVPAKAVKARHKAWLPELPRTDSALWEWLDALSSARRQELLAHCVSFGVNAFYDKNDRGGPWGVKRRIAHADRLARAVGLDPVQAGWSPTVDNYLGRVPKARILEAVREAKGEASAQLIDHLKKPDMAKEAERLLAKTGWLPEPLRTPDIQAEEAECESDGEDLPAFLDEEDDEELQEIAAE